MEIKNYMENIVFNMLDEVIDSLGGCKCERCRSDIAAYALNHLPTKYGTSNEVYSKLSFMQTQFSIDVVSQLAAGVQLVKDKPRHNQ